MKITPEQLKELDDNDDFDLEDICFQCGEFADSECSCCGEGLCHMHFELGAGFCPICPTEEWIKQQSDPKEKS